MNRYIQSRYNLNFSFVMYFIFSSLLAVMNTACQRGADEPSKTSVSISLPSTSGAQAVGSSELEHVVINISGSGMDTLAQTWSKHGSGGTFGAENAIPTFTFDVLQGSDRLIQALGVYKNSTTGSLDFYYGEVIQTISSDTSVNIPIAQVGSSSGLDAQISGRYIAGDGSSPSGLLNVLYTPPGRSSMIIMQTPMVQGWFNSFTLEGQAFDYQINGVSILGGSKQFSDFIAMAATPKVMIIKTPAYYYLNSASIPTLQQAQAEIRGIFGDGATASHKICYRNTSTQLAGYISKSWYENVATNPSYPYVAANPTYVSYNPSATFAASGSSLTITGGVAFNGSSPTDCASSNNTWYDTGNAYVLRVDPTITNPSYPRFSSKLSGGLNTDLIRSAYVSNPSFPSQFSYNLSWSYLPGVTAANYTHDVFAMTFDAYDFLAYDGHNSVNCEKMATYLDANGEIIKDGDLKVKRISSSLTPTNTSVPYSSISAFAYPVFVICPKKTSDGSYLPGAEIRWQ